MTGRLPKEIEAKYEVLAILGEGGMGSVYKVRHRLLDEIQIIKLMQAKFQKNQELRARFVREAKTAKQVRHRNIAEVIDYSVTNDGTAYIVMEFIEGSNLREILERNRSPLPYAVVVDVGVQSLAALGYLHRKGFVHRDVSPDNLMLTRDDRGETLIKLIDLGIAKAIEGKSDLTSAGRFLGKLQYASPEQFGGAEGNASVDYRSDLYSLGVVLYELLTATEPIVGSDYHAIIAGHLYRKPRPFEETDVNHAVPDAVRRVIYRALEKNLNDRFQSAEAFLEALQSAAPPKAGELPRHGVPLIAPIDRARSAPESAQEQADWDSAIAARSIARWEQYLDRYPHVPRAAEASRYLEELEVAEESDYEQAAKADSVAAWNHYLARHSESPRAAKARRRLDALFQRQAEAKAWEMAAARNDIAAWQTYLAAHGNSSRSPEARLRLQVLQRHEAESAAWNEAARLDTAAAWTSYLGQYSDSERVSSARQHLTAAEARERDERDWALAMSWQSSAGWAMYLRDHPDSARSAAARDYHQRAVAAEAEETAWRRASDADSPDAWRGFLAAYDSSSRGQQARARLMQAEEREQRETQRVERERAEREEEKAWRTAISAGTEARWDDYLRAFSAWPRAAQAHLHRLEVIDEREFEEAAKHDSIAEWNGYLARHPGSPRAVDARASLAAIEEREAEAKAWEIAANANDVAAWEHYLSLHPASHRAGEARQRLSGRKRQTAEEVAWAAATLVNSAAAWIAYLQEHAGSARAALARDHLKSAETEERAWSIAAQLDTVAAWEKYLGEHGGSRRAQAARSRHADAARLEDEEAAWQRALDQDSPASWREYLASHHQSSRADKARTRLGHAETRELEHAARKDRERLQQAEEKAWTAALAADSEEGWDAYLREHGNAPRAGEARRRTADLAEKRDYQEAAAKETLDGWNEYLRLHPGSKRAVEVRRRIDADREKEAEARAWNVATSSDDLPSWKRYLAEHGRSLRAADALRRISALEREIAERNAWEDAARIDTAEAWHSYLSGYADSARSREALDRLAAAEARELSRRRAANAESEPAKRVEDASGWELQEIRPQVPVAASPHVAEREIRRTSVEELRDTTPARRANIFTFVTLSAERKILSVVAAAIFIMGGVFLAARLLDRGLRPDRSVTSQNKVTTAKPSLPAVLGELEINALPWGNVTSVTDSRGINYVAGAAPAVTPVTLRVPAGRYRVSVSNPNSSQTRTIEVSVESTAIARCTVELDHIDATGYLDNAGIH